MNLAIVGSGYVGLVTGTCFAEVGHRVICVDNDLKKVHQLQDGTFPSTSPASRNWSKRTSPTAASPSPPPSATRSRPPTSSSSPCPPLPSPTAASTSAMSRASRVKSPPTSTPTRSSSTRAPSRIKTGEKVAQTIARVNPKADIDVVQQPRVPSRRFRGRGSDEAGPHRRRRLVGARRCPPCGKSTNRSTRRSCSRTSIPRADQARRQQFPGPQISYINAVAPSAKLPVPTSSASPTAWARTNASAATSSTPASATAAPASRRTSPPYPHLARTRLPVPPPRGSREDQLQPEGTLPQENPRGALGPAPEENRRARPRLQGQHRRRAQQRGHLGRATAHRRGAEVKAYDPKAMEKAKSLVPGCIMVDAPEKVADGADALLILTEWTEFKTLNYAR